MLAELPGWVVEDATSVREEMAPYVGATPEELWRHTEDCARDAMWAVRASGFPERVLAYEDPLPPSTIAALARLRDLFRERPADSLCASSSPAGAQRGESSCEVLRREQAPVGARDRVGLPHASIRAREARFVVA